MGIENASLKDIYAIEAKHPPLVGSRTSVVLRTGKQPLSTEVSLKNISGVQGHSGPISNIVGKIGTKKSAAVRILTRNRSQMSIGDFVRAQITEASPGSSIKKGEVFNVVVVRTNRSNGHREGSHPSRAVDVIAILDKRMNQRARRIMSSAARKLHKKTAPSLPRLSDY